ncbi:M-like protein [Deinococcus aetherius]|uniref:M-like protein n=1 Tax=Deinococcus aetherius TaxID=200252 RepID=A0ABM8ABT7_9DEIO|nr:M-like protein [Deinococcus aetherius]BDP41193.1 M-like protein [Deinococcus aetherius]
MTQSDDQQLQNGASTDSSVKTEDEISNVDLQFMGRTDEHRDALKDARAEARIADEYEDRGLDKQDVASSGSMITSDPASTTPGDETSDDTSNR